MRLKPVIASYLGYHDAILNTLTPRHITAVARLAVAPAARSELDAEVLQDLLDMHVAKLEEGQVKLATAVFLQEDIEQIINIAAVLGRELAQQLMTVGRELLNASPEIRNFLGGIIGVAQGLSRSLREQKAATQWRNYSGRFAKTKVDFNEICPPYQALGPNLQNKSLIRGERYTAVFIGPGGGSYWDLLSQIGGADDARAFHSGLAKYLADAYALLLSGELDHPGLQATAEQVGVFADGKPRDILVTREVFTRYAPVMDRISASAYQVYSRRLDAISECLQNTTSGRQGVSPANMMMHFGRYYRTVLAQELYRAGFFTDDVRRRGSITVFYENGIAAMKDLLG